MNKEFLLIGFIIVMGLFLISAIILGVLFFTKQRTVFRIISPNKRFKRHVMRGAVPEKINMHGGTYVYSEEAELRNFWGATIYYFDGNPNPIVFDHTKHKIITRASDLKHIIKNTIIEQLLASDSLTKIILILTGINLVVGIGILATMFISNPACTLANNPQNIEVLKIGIQQALA